MRTDRTVPPAISADPSWRIGIVYSSYYPQEVAQLLQRARETLIAAGIQQKNISEHPVPGCFEIPLVGSALAASKNVDALIALGIIVEGETHHADLIAQETARGVMDVQLQYRIPFAFEVLYVRKLTQAKARATEMHNKGAEAAAVVLRSLAALRDGTRH